MSGWLAEDQIALPTGTYTTITRLFVSVGTVPTGGTVIVRIGNAAGGLGSGISATIADGQSSGVATGAVVISGGAAYLRVTSQSGGAADLSGWIETDIDTATSQLTTLAKVKLQLGITVSTHDSLLSELIDAATVTAQNEIGRHLIETAYTGEVLSGSGFTDVLTVRHYPIAASPALVLYDDDGATISSADYEIEAASGIIRNINGSWARGTNNYSADYTGGYATVPADLVAAVTAHAVYLFTQTQPGGGRLGISGTSGLAGDSSTYLTDALLSQVERTFARYRRLI
jgi:uncharacterized phiE125 gp8 family phage protein